MNLNKFHIALALASLATGVMAQTVIAHLSASAPNQERLLIAQANTGQNSQAAQPGNQPGQGNPGMNQGPRRGPPPEAIAACNGKAVNAPCSFTNRENVTRTGTCGSPPPGGQRPPEGQGQQASQPQPCTPAAVPMMACRPDRSGQNNNQGDQNGERGQDGQRTAPSWQSRQG